MVACSQFFLFNYSEKHSRLQKKCTAHKMFTLLFTLHLLFLTFSPYIIMYEVAPELRSIFLHNRIYFLTYLLTYLLHGAEPLLRSYLVLQLVKRFPAFSEPEGSTPYPQAPATRPYPEPPHVVFIVCSAWNKNYTDSTNFTINFMKIHSAVDWLFHPYGQTDGWSVGQEVHLMGTTQGCENV
jgi:hypothetical protein